MSMSSAHMRFGVCICICICSKRTGIPCNNPMSGYGLGMGFSKIEIRVSVFELRCWNQPGCLDGLCLPT